MSLFERLIRWTKDDEAKLKEAEYAYFRLKNRKESIERLNQMNSSTSYTSSKPSPYKSYFGA